VLIFFYSQQITIVRQGKEKSSNDKSNPFWLQKYGDISGSHGGKYEVWIAFWDISPCSLDVADQRIRVAYCNHHQGDHPDDGGSKHL
jgi:hypothetical protein